MELSEQYRQQYGWRSWSRAFELLPPLMGQTVLDLGCAIGDQSAQLAERGASVIGVDADEELLSKARSRELANCEFILADLAALRLNRVVDGIWCSFTAAYFPDLPTILEGWRSHLKPGGWIAITEIDDLFGHQPLSPETESLLEGYAAQALHAGEYDFHAGSKLRGHLERAGFAVEEESTLEDDELAFNGAATDKVLGAWSARLDRMLLLQEFCGPRFTDVRDDLLACLASPDHRSTSRVLFFLAVSDPA